MYRLKFEIETLSPVVISAESNSTLMTGSHDEISGSVIRGVLAARYVEEKNLGKKAHADKDFQELFYGSLKFLAATPVISGKRSFNLPLSLQRGKKGTPNENNILDLLTGETPPGYKTLRGYGIVDGDKIFTASVAKNIYMHMSRSEDSERISGKSKEGNIYNYEALEEGQIFCGEILGEKNALEKIFAALHLEKIFIAYIGRSRFTQYGKCKFNFGSIEEIKPKNFGEKIYLRLESPLASSQDYFVTAQEILTAEVTERLGKNFKLGKVFSSSVEIENFYMTMKRPRTMALAAGTVFELEAKNLTSDDKKILGEKIYSGFGVRTEEGFGQVRFWQPSKLTAGKIDEIKISEPENFSTETLKIAQEILLEKFFEQIRIQAHEDANNLSSKNKDENSVHFFSRLENLLLTVNKKNLRKNFTEKISETTDAGRVFQDNLKKWKLNRQTLYHIFTENKKLPYEDKIIFGGTEKLFAKIQFNPNNYNDDFCFEYLKNFFRFARKNAAILNGGDKND